MASERERLEENKADNRPWFRWGPYVSERQWGTVREDYSADGDAWDFVSHDMARSYSYRWGEDGIGGFSDRHGLMNLSVAMWNGHDPILKERLFGLTNHEGNHGEDVKEVYDYQDALPSHAYMRMLYRYPQAAYPYEELVDVNRMRGQGGDEYEITDTGVFDGNRFFDCHVEYAKDGTDEIYWRVTVTNEGNEEADFWVIPQVTLGTSWKYHPTHGPSHMEVESDHLVKVTTDHYGVRYLAMEEGELLFTENETNLERLYGGTNEHDFVKDAFHAFVVNDEKGAVNPDRTGTKLGVLVSGRLKPGEKKVVRLRLSTEKQGKPFEGFDEVFEARISEADEFYKEQMRAPDETQRAIQRRAMAGLIWSKQLYRLDQDTWETGDEGMPKPPPGHANRNKGWEHIHAGDIFSMPDAWEYPWFAAWDLAFHTVTFALADPTFAKDQLLLLLREWYMHPSGQIPAYEWNFSDVNPPVHAWAAHRVFQIERRLTGKGDYQFLEKVFHKLLLNFTWWVNRKDVQGNNIFEGGFLGLDNIGVFDRSTPLPSGLILEQSDGTSWMAMFALDMLGIAVELSRENPAYEDVASKFFEHFVYISSAMEKCGIWDEADGFYYDVITSPDGSRRPIKVPTLVGLIPLLAVTVLEPEDMKRMAGFRRRFEWFQTHEETLMGNFCFSQHEESERHILALVDPDSVKRILCRMLDEGEFLSPYGIRSVSKVLEGNPHSEEIDGKRYEISYEPGVSRTGLFGGNSNWRGPVWMPINFLLIEALQEYDYFLGSDFQVQMPSNSGDSKTLWEVSQDLSGRLLGIFLPDSSGKRAVFADKRFAEDPKWKEFVWFYEYFHGETGQGLGASHQTGWTALVAKLIDQAGTGSAS